METGADRFVMMGELADRVYAGSITFNSDGSINDAKSHRYKYSRYYWL